MQHNKSQRWTQTWLTVDRALTVKSEISCGTVRYEFKTNIFNFLNIAIAIATGGFWPLKSREELARNLSNLVGNFIS